MKKSTIWLLTAVMACAVLGLLSMQIMYMENMIKMRDEQFSETVTHCLYGVTRLLEQDETKYYLDQDLQDAQTSFNPSLKSFGDDLPKAGAGGTISGIDGVTAGPQLGYDKDMDNNYRSKQEMLKGQYLYQKSLLNEVVLNILSKSGDRPITERADSTTVREYLTHELENNGMSLPFEFAVSSPVGLVYHSAQYAEDDEEAVYSQVLFPNDPVNMRNYLKVYFPTKEDYVFSKVKFIIPTFMFTLVLLIIFIFTIIVAFRQKRVTEIKNDFINNMTHEFKTPISSISIAAQMLNDDSVRKSPAMLKHVSTVINDETKRLRFQVEKVLQMSMFDRKNATMKLEEVNADELIYGVVNTFTLKVEKYGGAIEPLLESEDPIVNVDKMHFTNVIFNLLDNAIKYRREDVPLNLKVVTSNPDEDHIKIVVEDNGIGIKREDLKKIFEKFYRVSTGNRHDVKGFGLGLAYVYKMVTLFGGTIKAESELNKGTKFIIILPLLK